MPSLSTVLDFLARHQTDRPAQPALIHAPSGSFQAVTWRQIADDVERAARAAIAWGVEPAEHVVLLAENRYEWLIADLALQAAGAVVVTLSTALTARQLADHTAHCGATRAIVSAALWPRWQEAGLESIPAVVLPSTPIPATRSAHSWGDFLDRATASKRLASLASRLDPAAVATLIYTSGTAGEPKGVMLTHGNLAFDAWATWTAFQNPPSERRFSMLPWSHAFARTCDLFAWLASGTQFIIGRSRETLFDDLRATQPTYLNSVPHFFDKIRIAASQAGAPPSQQMLGGAMRACCSGGAPLPHETFDHFQQQGISVLQGYGLTEASPVVTTCTETAFRRGSVGHPLPGVELRIADDGEVLTRGPHVMAGYHRDSASTAAAIQGGWLHTGDLGQIDNDGFLYLTGRKKELIVLSSGLKVSPSYLESLLTQHPRIQQAMVVGDALPYLVALIVPAQTTHAVPTTHEELASYINHQLRHAAPHEQIRQFAILEQPFTVETGELTVKLTLRRDVIAARYARQIAQLFDH